MHDEMEAISGDDFFDRVAAAQTAADEIDEAPPPEGASESSADDATPPKLPSRDPRARRRRRRRRRRDPSRAETDADAIRRQFEEAAAAEAMWEAAMRDAADVAEEKARESDAHYDADGWAERRRGISPRRRRCSPRPREDEEEDEEETKEPGEPRRGARGPGSPRRRPLPLPAGAEPGSTPEPSETSGATLRRRGERRRRGPVASPRCSTKTR